MATYKIRPEAAARAQGMITFHHGDVQAAAYDVRLGLRSIGHYTDRKAETALEILDWLRRQDEKFPETKERRHAKLAEIAAQHKGSN